MKKLSIIFASVAMLFGVGLGVSALDKGSEEAAPVEKVEAATPSSYSKIYRFTAPAEYWGGTVYVYAWGSSDSSKNTDWPGINISSEYSFNESDRKVYTFCTNVSDYKYLIFHNNSGWQTDNITIGSNTAWYLDSGNTPGTWTPTNQTYYFYDYRNLLGGNAQCYAWQSNGSLNNGDYPGVAMTKVPYGSGQLYSISLDPAFDECIFGIGNSCNTGDLWINHNRGNCYCWWETEPGWSSDLDWAKAHDWIYNTMHVRDISQETTSDTGACKGASGYYAKAKAAYQSFSAAIKTKISQDECWGVAQARFSAWARANGESASFSGTTLTVSSTSRPLFAGSEDTTTTIAVIIVSIVALGAVGGFFLVKRKKKLD